MKFDKVSDLLFECCRLKEEIEKTKQEAWDARIRFFDSQEVFSARLKNKMKIIGFLAFLIGILTCLLIWRW